MAQQVALMTVEELNEREERIERGFETFIDVGNALREIRDRRGYRTAGYDRFEDYLFERWELTRDRAYQLIAAASVSDLLSSNVENFLHTPPDNESQARALAPLAKTDPDAAREVWQEVQDEHGDKVTASKVREAVKERMPQRTYACPECGENWTTKQAAGECCAEEMTTAFDSPEWTRSQQRRARQAVESLPANQRESAVVIATTDADPETTIKRLERLTKVSVARRSTIINEAGNDLDSAITMLDELNAPVDVERIAAVERAIEFLEPTYQDYPDDPHSPRIRSAATELRRVLNQMTDAANGEHR